MFKKLALFLTLFVGTFALAQSPAASVSGNFSTLLGGNPASGSISFTVVNCDTSKYFLKAGTKVITELTKTFYADPATGAFSGTIWGTDQMTCNGVATTMYAVVIYDNGKPVNKAKYYHITSLSGFDPNTAADVTGPAAALASRPLACVGAACWNVGSGAPTGTCTAGSFYTRTDTSSSFYVCNSGAWALVSGGGGGGGGVTSFNTQTGDITYVPSWSSITGKPSTFTPSTHNHLVADITNFPATWPWASLSGVPSTFTPSTHSHGFTDLPLCGTDGQVYKRVSGTMQCAADATSAGGGSGVSTFNGQTGDVTYAPAWTDVTGKPDVVAKTMTANVTYSGNYTTTFSGNVGIPKLAVGNPPTFGSNDELVNVLASYNTTQANNDFPNASEVHAIFNGTADASGGSVRAIMGAAQTTSTQKIGELTAGSFDGGAYENGNNVGLLQGISSSAGVAPVSTTGNADKAVGGKFSTYVYSGTIGEAIGVEVVPQIDTNGAITTQYGVKINPMTVYDATGTSIGSLYGLYIGDNGLTANRWGLYVAGGRSYVGGTLDVAAFTIGGNPLATVATSGAYSDLTGRPTLPANTSAVTNQFLTSYNSSTGAFGQAQPSSSNLSDSGNLVKNNAANTYTTGAQDFGSATSLKVPTSAGAAPTANGQIAYDSTANQYSVGVNASNKKLAYTDSNITGTAANLSGTPALPNGTTATTQTQGDNSTKLATTAYVDTLGATKAASNASTTVNGTTCTLGSTCTVTASVTQSKSAVWESPAASDVIPMLNPAASGTIARVHCNISTGTNVVFNLYKTTEAAPWNTGSGTAVFASDQTCTTSGIVITSFSSASFTAHVPIVARIVSQSGSPAMVFITVEF